MVNEPQTRMTVHAHVKGPKPIHEIYEGEAKMSQQQQDAYKNIIGDGLGRVTVGRDLSEKDFGNGGGVFVNITLACDQSQAGFQAAIPMAFQLADQWCWFYQRQLADQLVQEGLLKQ